MGLATASTAVGILTLTVQANFTESPHLDVRPWYGDGGSSSWKPCGPAAQKPLSRSLPSLSTGCNQTRVGPQMWMAEKVYLLIVRLIP